MCMLVYSRAMAPTRRYDQFHAFVIKGIKYIDFIGRQ